MSTFGALVGTPAEIWLNKFGVIVKDYFGHRPYQIFFDGKERRDVDVLLILPDEEFRARFGDWRNYRNPKIAAITLAFSALGKEMIGLPINFEIQSQTLADTVGSPRSRWPLYEVQPSSGAEQGPSTDRAPKADSQFRSIFTRLPRNQAMIIDAVHDYPFGRDGNYGVTYSDAYRLANEQYGHEFKNGTFVKTSFSVAWQKLIAAGLIKPHPQRPHHYILDIPEDWPL